MKKFFVGIHYFPETEEQSKILEGKTPIAKSKRRFVDISGSIVDVDEICDLSSPVSVHVGGDRYQVEFDYHLRGAARSCTVGFGSRKKQGWGGQDGFNEEDQKAHDYAMGKAKLLFGRIKQLMLENAEYHFE